MTVKNKSSRVSLKPCKTEASILIYRHDILHSYACFLFSVFREEQEVKVSKVLPLWAGKVLEGKPDHVYVSCVSNSSVIRRIGDSSARINSTDACCSFLRKLKSSPAFNWLAKLVCDSCHFCRERHRLSMVCLGICLFRQILPTGVKSSWRLKGQSVLLTSWLICEKEGFWMCSLSVAMRFRAVLSSTTWWTETKY